MLKRTKKFALMCSKLLWAAAKAALPFIPDGTIKPTAIAGVKLAELLTKQGFEEKEVQQTASALENSQKDISEMRRDLYAVRLLLVINLILTAFILLLLF